MTRLETLKELAANVEAGDGDADTWRDAWRHDGVWDWKMAALAKNAFHGSLDAAKALHEAVLPGWVVYRSQWWPTARDPAICELWQTRENRAGSWCHSHPDLRVDACGEDPARAWLLAILRALIAQEAAE